MRMVRTMAARHVAIACDFVQLLCCFAAYAVARRTNPIGELPANFRHPGMCINSQVKTKAAVTLSKLPI